MDDSSRFRRGARLRQLLVHGLLASVLGGLAACGGTGAPATRPRLDPAAAAPAASSEPSATAGGRGASAPAWDRAAYRARLAELPDRRCRIGRSAGDAELARLADGTVLLVTSGLELWRSVDGGATFAVDALPVDSWWPAIETDGDRVWIAGGEREPPRLVVLRSVDGGRTFEPPRTAWATGRWILDPELLLLRSGALLLFATEVEGEANVQAGTYRVHVLRSDDGGTTWSDPQAIVEGRRGVQLEDLQAIELPSGEVLLAYEFEERDRGPSSVHQVRSSDQGASWSEPVVVWPGSSIDGLATAIDVEPGGYLQRGDTLWLYASSDAAEPGASYAGARLERRLSRDGGWSWSAPEVLVDRADQLALSLLEVPDPEGAETEVGLLSLSFYDQARFRSLFFYRLDDDGAWRCSTGGGAGSGSDAGSDGGGASGASSRRP